MTKPDLSEEIDYSDPHLELDIEYTRFGYSMIALDINHDGIDDLVVSAPSQGKGGPTDIHDYYPKTYTGRVYVYLGSKEKGIIKG